MAIEITSKTGIRKNLWKIILLFISILLFLSLLVSYFYINIISEKISQDIENKKQDLSKSASERELENKLLLYESKINAFDKLLSNHQKTLNVFLFLEKISHPNIWFSEFTFNSVEALIIASGQAKSFIDLGQQLIILKEEEDFKKINLSEISMNDEGKVNFDLQLNLESEVLK